MRSFDCACSKVWRVLEASTALEASLRPLSKLQPIRVGQSFDTLTVFRLFAETRGSLSGIRCQTMFKRRQPPLGEVKAPFATEVSSRYLKCRLKLFGARIATLNPRVSILLRKFTFRQKCRSRIQTSKPGPEYRLQWLKLFKHFHQS